MPKVSSSTEQAPGEEIVHSNSSEETIKLGQTLAKSLNRGDVVALFGELGSGKTTFIKGICAGLESENNISSPTFTLINEYSGRFPIYHFDCYRIETSDELWQLGCDEYFYGEGICLIEWAEKISDLLPEKRVEVYLKSRFSEGFESSREIRIVKK